MFETCEWNDEGNGQTLSQLIAEKKTSDALDKGTTSRKKRLKRNQQLLEVLRSLNTPSTLHPELPPPPEATPPKRQKRMAPDVMSTSPSLPEDEPAVERLLESPLLDRLSRRQWKNKLKNKRRNRNKFKTISETDKQTRGGQEGTADRDRGATAREETPCQRGEGKSQQPRGECSGATTAVNSAQGRHTPKTQPLLAGERSTLGAACGLQGDRVSKQVTPRERARLQKLKKLMQHETGAETTKTPIEEDHQGTSEQPEVEQDPAAALRARMEERLSSARFRYINEQLYTSDSQEALRLFQEDPEAFTIYHSGFSQQVQRWPTNPITGIIKYIKNRPSSLVLADFGCGDALLARSVRNKVHSFDLVALNDRVTVCDMAKVPLSDGSVDVAVFCLSLMGKNLEDFLREANRVLKLGGVLLVAEVSSRFDDVRQFLTAMSQMGFKSVNKNTENSHFFLFEFSKIGRARDATRHPGLQLKPCLYKRR